MEVVDSLWDGRTKYFFRGRKFHQVSVFRISQVFDDTYTYTLELFWNQFHGCKVISE